MRIECLFPEMANLYGESGQWRFLKRLLPEAEAVETSLGERPAFARAQVDFLYVGPMSESAQERALEALRPYAAALRTGVEAGMHGLFVGNALELLGRRIADEGRSLEGLGLLPLRAERHMRERLNCYYVGRLGRAFGPEAEGLPLVGFKSQFSEAFWEEGAAPEALAATEKGFALNRGIGGEGFVWGNVVGTYLIGPLLILNPELSRAWLRKLGCAGRALPFAETLDAAYRNRLEDFRRADTVL